MKRELPNGVEVTVRVPSEVLGDLRSTLWGTQAQVESWIELGAKDAEAWLAKA
ncbi:MAG: hypothetical protein WDO18_04695 [Acidobacteriota bacterium]